MMERNHIYSVLTVVLGITLLFIISGCATLTTGSSQAITINTKPSGATCTLTRNGMDLAVINPTPGSITVDKSKDDISVICRKEGYQENAAICSSSFQGMTLGNILFGGLIGLAVDIGSGSAHRYPPMLTLTLIPREFISAAERDAFFETMKSECLLEATRILTQLSENCANANDDKKASCTADIKSAESVKDKRLADIERMRSLSVVKN
jgi:hypothetical protein